MDERSRVWRIRRFVVLSVIASLACFATIKPGIAEERASAAPTVNGTVVDDRTGLPIPDFTVTYGDNGSIPYWQRRETRPFTDGRFGYGPPAYFDGKEYRIQVQAKGYKAAVSRLIRRTESDVKLDFRLVPPERFAGV